MPPTSIAPMMMGTPSGVPASTVVTTAIAMPAMPNRLPRLAVAGWLSPLRLRMNSALAPR
ncbi:hypothetical protein D9M68_911190 [compost metagenome]